jgi:hypothetical protein
LHETIPTVEVMSVPWPMLAVALLPSWVLMWIKVLRAWRDYRAGMTRKQTDPPPPPVGAARPPLKLDAPWRAGAGRSPAQRSRVVRRDA